MTEVPASAASQQNLVLVTASQDLINELAPRVRLTSDNLLQSQANQVLARALKRIDVDNVEKLYEYQQFVGLPVKKEIDRPLIENIAWDLKFADKLSDQPQGEPPTDCEPCGPFLNDGSNNYIIRRGSREELWTVNADRSITRSTDGVAIARFHEVGKRIARESSREDFHVLYAVPSASSSDLIDVQYGQGELKSLPRAGFVQQLARLVDTDSAPITILSDGTTNDPDLQATPLAAALKAQIGGGRDVFVAKDVFSGAAYDHQRKLQNVSVRTGGDIAVYTSGMIQDWGAVEQVQKSLQRAGIQVNSEEAGLVPSSAGNVIAIIGHRGPEMGAFLARLKDAGVVRDKIVLLMSCYDSDVESAQSILTRGDNGAIGVFYFSDAIRAPEVASILYQLGRAVGSGEVAGQRLDHVFEHAARLAAKNATLNEKLDIELLLYRMTTQLSGLERDCGSDTAA